MIGHGGMSDRFLSTIALVLTLTWYECLPACQQSVAGILLLLSNAHASCWSHNKCCIDSNQYQAVILILTHLLLSVNDQGKIFGHLFVHFNKLYTCLFQVLGELSESLVVVKLGSMCKTTCPSKDGSNGIGGCGVTLIENWKAACNALINAFSFQISFTFTFWCSR